MPLLTRVPDKGAYCFRARSIWFSGGCAALILDIILEVLNDHNILLERSKKLVFCSIMLEKLGFLRVGLSVPLRRRNASKTSD